jgi:hypothetical protein
VILLGSNDGTAITLGPSSKRAVKADAVGVKVSSHPFRATTVRA